jgi:hypothetical protein
MAATRYTVNKKNACVAILSKPDAISLGDIKIVIYRLSIMPPVLQYYFQLLNSDNFSTRNESVLAICSLMEMHSWKLCIEKRKIRYDYLDDEIINLKLTDFQLAEIVKYIFEKVLYPLLINNNRQTFLLDSINGTIIFGMIRCLEESPSNIGLIPTLNLFISCSKVINNEIYAWLASALGKLIFISNHLSNLEKKKILIDINCIPFLKERLLELYSESQKCSTHTELREHIEYLIDGIEKIITDRYEWE